jgi:hypothetical protein
MGAPQGTDRALLQTVHPWLEWVPLAAVVGGLFAASIVAPTVSVRQPETPV